MEDSDRPRKKRRRIKKESDTESSTWLYEETLVWYDGDSDEAWESLVREDG